MDASIFLVHVDSAGAKTNIQLTLYPQKSVFWLPNAATPPLTISSEKDSLHSKICLELEAEYSLLSVYSNVPDKTFMLGTTEIEMPLSTTSHQKSIILTQDLQFLTPAGRWQVMWEMDNAISNSMRPPALPNMMTSSQEYDELEIEEDLVLVPSEQGGQRLVDSRDIDEMSDGAAAESIAITEIHLPPSEEKIDEHTTEADNEQTWQEDIDLTTPDTEMLHNANDRQDEAARTKIPRAWQVGEESQQEELNSDTPEFGKINAHDKDTALDTLAPLEQTKVQGSNTLCLGEPKDPFAEDDDEETASENDNDSPLQLDNRKLKHRLSEIEQDLSPLPRKKAKTASDATQSSIQADAFALHSQSNDMIVSPSPSETSAKKKVSWKDIEDAKKNSGVSKVKGRQRSKLPPTISTGARTSSRRRSLTPVTGSPAKNDYGRPKVIFGSTSQIPQDKKTMSIISKLGGSVVTDINEADVLCIGNGPIKKTSKFVIAVAKGKDIVTDDWVRNANEGQKLPDRQPFLPQDEDHEREWNFNLQDAIDRGKRGLNLLNGIHVHFTSQLRQDLGNLTKEVKEVALALGAAATHNGLPKKTSKYEVIVLGSTKKTDPEAANVARLGHKLYGQDILIMGALRGNLQLDASEFMIGMPVKMETGSE